MKTDAEMVADYTAFAIEWFNSGKSTEGFALACWKRATEIERNRSEHDVSYEFDALAEIMNDNK